MVGLHKEMKNTKHCKYAGIAKIVLKSSSFFKDILKGNCFEKMIIILCAVYTEIKCLKRQHRRWVGGNGSILSLLKTLCILSLFSHVQLFVTLWTIAHQALLSLGFSRQEYWSELPFPPPGDLPDQGLKPGILHCRQILYQLRHR